MKAIFRSEQRSVQMSILLLVVTSIGVHGQTGDLVLQTFDRDICGWNSYSSPAVTLAFDPTQDNTGNGGGSCHVLIAWSQPGVYAISGSYEDCCFCFNSIRLVLTNFTSVDFDLKWDPAYPVSPDEFNSNPALGSPGVSIDAEGTNNVLLISPTVCYSNLYIPESAIGGWVHIHAPINPSSSYSTNASTGIALVGTIPSGGSGQAAFWLDNIELNGRQSPKIVQGACRHSGDSFTLQWTATYGDTCTVLKSTDLVHWTTLATGYPEGGMTNGAASLIDTGATNPCSFYRVRDP